MFCLYKKLLWGKTDFYHILLSIIHKNENVTSNVLIVD